jgi:hypothetical protein
MYLVPVAYAGGKHGSFHRNTDCIQHSTRAQLCVWELLRVSITWLQRLVVQALQGDDQINIQDHACIIEEPGWYLYHASLAVHRMLDDCAFKIALETPLSSTSAHAIFCARR